MKTHPLPPDSQVHAVGRALAMLLLLSSVHAGAAPFVETARIPLPTSAMEAWSVDAFGDRIAVGYDDGGAGGVVVYRRDAATGAWTQEQVLASAGGVAGDEYGFDVALWDDVLVVGAPAEAQGLSLECGAVYVYRRSGSAWSLEQKITPLGCSIDELPELGESVDLTEDVLIAGARRDDTGVVVPTGLAKIYRYDSGSGIWAFEANLVGSDSVADDFCGDDVAVSGDLAVVHCSRPFGSGSALYSFSYDGAAWTNEQKLSGSGSGLELSGNRLVAHASNHIAAYEFDGASWSSWVVCSTCREGTTFGFAGSLVAYDSPSFFGGIVVGTSRLGPDNTAQFIASDTSPEAGPRPTAAWNGGLCGVEPGGCPAGATLDDRIVRVVPNLEVSVLEAVQCADADDNDGDGLVDTEDPDCTDGDDRSEWSLAPGDAVVADEREARILRVDPVSGASTELVAGGALVWVRDAVLGPQGSLWAVDLRTRSLVRFDPSTARQQLVAWRNQIVGPESLAVEADGKVVIGDVATDTVIRVDPSTGAQSLLLPAESFANAHGIDVAGDGSIWLADDGFNTTATVSLLDPVSGAETVVATGLAGPFDGADDGSGRFFFPEAEPNGSTADEILSVEAASPGASPVLVSNDPLLVATRDVAVEATGMLLAADLSSGLLRVDPTLGPSANATILFADVVAEGVDVRRAECDDGFDNDGDGLVDATDPDCLAASDDSEGRIRLVDSQKISDTAGYLTSPGSPGSNPGGLLDDRDWFGWQVAALDDIDGDGVEDLAVTARRDGHVAAFGTAPGAVYVLLLNPDGSVKQRTKLSKTSGGLDVALAAAGLSLADDDEFGTGLAYLGDLDGPGGSDFALAVGAWRDDGVGGADRGAVYVLFMQSSPVQVLSVVEIGDGGAGGFPASELDDSDFFGGDVEAVGDVNGDGVVDLAVGATLDDDNALDAGAVWILFLQPDGTVLASPPPVRISAPAASGDNFGHGIAPLGDLDGDTVPDLAISAHRRDGVLGNDGAVWIVTLNSDGTQKTAVEIGSGTEPALASFLDTNDSFGLDVSPLPDLDGDGTIELAAGAFRDDDAAADAGAIYVLFLTPSGSLASVEKLSARYGGLPVALDGNDRFGINLTTLDDLDGDGNAELVAGAVFDDSGGPNRGAVYVMSIEEADAICGDGAVQVSEECDDGNTLSQDGCSSLCLVEFCGDGVVQAALGESCDDGNLASEDGCSITCQVEFCGDGTLQAGLGEECDDGNLSSGDGCSMQCAVEFCGDGHLQEGLGEQCDDGATVDFDGCGSTCLDEWSIGVSGDPMGGQVLFTVEGLPLSVATLDVQTPEQVAASLAFEINNNATLASLGVTALADGDIIYTNGSVTDLSNTDAGLALELVVGPGTEPPPPAVPSGDVVRLLAPLLIAVAAWRWGSASRSARRRL